MCVLKLWKETNDFYCLKEVRKRLTKKVEIKTWKLKNEHLEKNYIKIILKVIKKKLNNEKTVKKFKKTWKTREFGQMVRLG